MVALTDDHRLRILCGDIRHRALCSDRFTFYLYAVLKLAFVAKAATIISGLFLKSASEIIVEARDELNQGLTASRLVNGV